MLQTSVCSVQLPVEPKMPTVTLTFSSKWRLAAASLTWVAFSTTSSNYLCTRLTL